MSRATRHGGYIRLYRSLIDCATFRNVPEAMAFAWMILRASWREDTVRYKGRQITLERGDLAISTRDFAAEWEWSEAKVRRYLTRLSTDAMIDARSDAGVNIITICNYDEFQKITSDADAPSDAEGDAKATQYRRSTDAQNKEEKEIKEDKKDLFSSQDVGGETDAMFEQFWALYRRKNDGKKDARRAWVKAVKKAAPGEIIAAAERYIASLEPEKRHGSFQKMAASWLNAEGFFDDYVPYGGKSEPNGQQDEPEWVGDLDPANRGYFNMVRYFIAKGEVFHQLWCAIDANWVDQRLVDILAEHGYDHANPKIAGEAA